MCATLDVPVVGGNVSLYNDSEAGPIPPTPTLMMVGKREGVDAPPARLSGDGTLLLVGDPDGALGGSEYLHRAGGSDQFPALPVDPAERIAAIADVATADETLAAHDVSNGGLGVALAELVTDDVGADVEIPGSASPAERLFCERPGRAVIETTDPAGVRERLDGVAPVTDLGTPTGDGRLHLDVDGASLRYSASSLREMRDTIERELES
jgi:phosphoribosylformylglycinamidine synthase